MRFGLAILLTALSNGCTVDANYAGTGYQCDEAAPHCPPGQICVSGFCTGAIDGSAPDSRLIDAPEFDARLIDAPEFDAATFDAPEFDATTFDAATFDAAEFDAATFDAGPPADAAHGNITVQLGDGSDDAEQAGGPAGTMYLTDDALNIGSEVVGFRFAAVPIPAGATIESAHLQLTARSTSGAFCSIIVTAHDTDNAPAFTTDTHNITFRPTTTAQAAWTIPAWTAGASGDAQKSPDLTTVIQEVVDRPGWSEGNAIVLILVGAGNRVAESVEGLPGGAAELVVTY